MQHLGVILGIQPAAKASVTHIFLFNLVELYATVTSPATCLPTAVLITQQNVATVSGNSIHYILTSALIVLSHNDREVVALVILV